MKTLNKKLKTGYNHESNYYKQTHVYQSAWSGPNSLLGWALFSEDWSLLHRSTSSPRLICHSTTGWSRDSFSFPQWFLNGITLFWNSGWADVSSHLKITHRIRLQYVIKSGHFQRVLTPTDFSPFFRLFLPTGQSICSRHCEWQFCRVVFHSQNCEHKHHKLWFITW